MKTEYCIGQRVAFIARNECTVEGETIKGKWQHHVGYVKQIRRGLFNVVYVVILHKSDEIFIVPQRDILGVVEKRENTNKTDKPNENAI